MRKHRRARNVAHRKDMRRVGAQLFIDANEAAVRYFDAGGGGAYERTIGHTPHGDKHAAKDLRTRRVLACKCDTQALCERLDARHLGPRQNLFIARANALLERPHEIRVASGHELRQKLNDADAAAERVIYACHLKSDDATADDEELAVKLRKLQSPIRVHDARIIRQAWQPHRLGACRNDALLEADARGAGIAYHLDDVRAHELSNAVHNFHLALLREQLQAPRELLHDGSLPLAKCRQI